MRYKQGWQEGVVRVTDAAGVTAEIPFRLSVGMRVDLESDDLDASLPAGTG